MWVYYSIILTLFFSSWVSRFDTDLSRKHFIAFIVGIAAFSAFRYAVGCDYFSYSIHYDYQDKRFFLENIPSIDPLYWILIDAISFMRWPYEALNIASSLFFFSGLYVLCRRFAHPMAILAFSFPVMIIALPMSATRQALAAGVIMMALPFLMDRRFVKYLVFVVVASLFHSSALLFAFMAPLVYFGGSARAWAFAAPIIIGGLFLLTGSEAFEVANTRYIQGNNDAQGGAFRTFLLFACGVYFQLALKAEWRRKFSESFAVINPASMILIGLFPLAFFVPTIADRMGQYFMVIAAIIMANVPHLKVPQRDRAFLIAMLVLITFFVGWSSLSWQIRQCYDPYQSWLFGFPAGANTGP